MCTARPHRRFRYRQGNIYSSWKKEKNRISACAIVIHSSGYAFTHLGALVSVLLVELLGPTLVSQELGVKLQRKNTEPTRVSTRTTVKTEMHVVVARIARTQSAIAN